MTLAAQQDASHIADTLGLYVSIPFCKAKCTFCNFASDAFPLERMSAYVERLCREIESAQDFAQQHGLYLPQTADTVYLGGGTPSLLQPAQMLRLLTTLRSHVHITTTAEFTVEAAPGQIADDLLQVLLGEGANRISLGVQSFIDAESRAVGRFHTAAQCIAEIDRLRAAGVSNLSLDLIAGLPHQTIASWAESLRIAIATGVDHISVYMLEIDEDSRLGRELLQSKSDGLNARYSAAATPSDDLTAELYEQACATLGAAGIQQYEISNFARPGRESQHNRKYWTRSPYLGLGLDAHSMLTSKVTPEATRFANTDNLETYFNENEQRELDTIDQLAAYEESIFLGLRLTEGVSVAALRQRYPGAWIEVLESRAKDLSREGLMRIDSGRAALTPRGRILSSTIFGELLAREPATL